MNLTAPHGKGRAFADRRRSICCDVLDAWFAPSPAVIQAFEATALAMRTSPDTEGMSLKLEIAKARGLDPDLLSLGAGSSEIIHRVLPTVAGVGPVVLLDPTYSEYGFVLERAGIKIRRIPLCRDDGFRVPFDALLAAAQGATLVVLVNPNNPTGRALSRKELLEFRASMPSTTGLWVDEAYVDYCPPDTSVEADAGQIEGLYVLKSLSKAYALSGIRAAYLVADPAQVATPPPWIIGTSAQSAAIAAVRDRAYYADRWRESRDLLCDFVSALRELGLVVHQGFINAALIECPANRSGSQWAEELASNGLIVRTTQGMGDALGDRYIRIGLVERSLQARVIEIVEASLRT